MIRGFHLTDFFTLANAACGMATVSFAMRFVDGGAIAHFYLAAVMAPAASGPWARGNCILSRSCFCCPAP